VSTDQWKCLKADGIEFAVVRAWHSYGGPDTAAPRTVQSAWDGGLHDVDVYLFPCRSKSASDQVAGTIENMKGVKFGQM